MSERTTVAIVPARGGSKGVPRKNLVEVAGRTLVDWAVAAGLAAVGVDRVIVSTDDAEIAREAERAGAEVPFVRPAALSGDDVTDLPVIQHVLDHLAEHEGSVPDLVVQLRPTSPVRPAGLVDRGIEILRRRPEVDSVRAVCEAPLTPYKMWTIDDDDPDAGRLRPLLGSMTDELYNQPRQQLPTVWWQIGVLDVVRASVVRGGSMSGATVAPLCVGPELACDIDGPEDIARAEILLRGLER
ncbi:MAG TPA: acylneuraminate cytidylyltransferase family protein [Iamia sp.]|nr:acylneuraminate cytidylyltransferase family protein [Iamia sp.]